MIQCKLQPHCEIATWFLPPNFSKKVSRGGARSKDSTNNNKKKKKGGGSDKDGDTQKNQHTPPAHSPPGDEGCYCFAACSMDKHPLPVPLPDHATQRTKLATKLQLIQMANYNID